MKAQVLTAILLMSALTTFAQTSRRDNGEKSSNNDNNQRVEEQKSTDNRNSESYSRERRGNDQHQENNSGVQEKRGIDQQNPDNHPRVQDQRNNDQRNQGSNSGMEQRRDFQQNSENHSRMNEKRNDRSYSGQERHDDHSRINHDDRQPNPSSSRFERRDFDHSTSSQRVITRDRYDRHPRRVVVVDRNYHYERPSSTHVHVTYRAPVRSQIVWSLSLSRDYRLYYPEIHYWKYRTGYRIASIPAYNAYDYVGEVANVYGRVQEVYFEPEADEFYLYFGDFYPRQDFTVIIPGRIAREFNHNPFRFFQDQSIAVNGYVQIFDNKPEILVRGSRQIDIY